LHRSLRFEEGGLDEPPDAVEPAYRGVEKAADQAGRGPWHPRRRQRWAPGWKGPAMSPWVRATCPNACPERSCGRRRLISSRRGVITDSRFLIPTATSQLPTGASKFRRGAPKCPAGGWKLPTGAREFGCATPEFRWGPRNCQRSVPSLDLSLPSFRLLLPNSGGPVPGSPGRLPPLVAVPVFWTVRRLNHAA